MASEPVIGWFPLPRACRETGSQSKQLAFVAGVALLAASLLAGLFFAFAITRSLPVPGPDHTKLGEMEFMSRNLAGAVAEYRGAQTVDPSNPRNSGQLAQTLAAAGDSEGVLAAIRFAAEHQFDAQLYRQLADAALAKRRSKQARRALERALVLEPDDAETWVRLGSVQLELGAPAEARAAYARALDLEPSMGAAHAGLVDAYAALGEDELAREHERAAGRGGESR